MTEAEEDEAWRLLGQGMWETLRKDCEAIMVKGYSPLRRWLRQERVRANQRYVRTGPLVLGYDGLASLEERVTWMRVHLESQPRWIYGVNT